MFSNFLCTVGAAIALVLLPVVPALASSDPVIAIVNGTKIYRSAVELLPHILPQAQGMSADSTMQEEILNYLITAELLRAEMRRQKLDQDPVVKTQLAEMERRVFRHAYQTYVIEREITEAVLREQYELVVKSLPEREEIRAHHILLKSESEAQAALADIRHGADFASVARERSLDKSKERGGDLGFLPKETLLESFVHATTTLQPGQMNDQPVQSPFGWHVIRLEERRLSKPNFEDVKDEIKTELVQKKLAQSLEILRTKANIQRIPLPAQDSKLP